MTSRCWAVGLTVVLSTLVGCTTPAPTAPERPAPIAGSSRLSAEDRAFLRAVAGSVAEERGVMSVAGETSAPREAVPSGSQFADGAVSVAAATAFFRLTAWDAGTDVVAAMTDDRAVAERITRGLVVRDVRGTAGAVAVAARRFPASLGLHWSGWQRQDWGRWRDPGTGTVLDIRRPGVWWFAVPGGGGTIPPGEDGRIAAAAELILRAAGTAPIDEGAALRGVVVAEGLEIAGAPTAAVPTAATVWITEADASENRGDGAPAIRATVALPFADDRSARVGLVTLRLFAPAILTELGIPVDRGTAIERDGATVLLRKVLVPLEVLMPPDEREGETK